MTAPGPLDKTFTAALHKSPAKGGWTYSAARSCHSVTARTSCRSRVTSAR